jgi:urease accessory protein
MQEFHKVEGIIEADNVEGRTSVVKNYHRYPLKFLTVDTARRQTLAESRTVEEEDGAQQQRRRGPLAPIWVYAVTYGGGLVAGDDIGLKFTVRRDAALVLTTQASTKVYKSRSPGRSAQGETAGHLVCHQTLAANVESGALLAIVPHAVTCFADARYKQRQVVRMEEGANLILVDWLTSGRVARGEEWAFESYETTNDVLLDDQLLVREAVSLALFPLLLQLRSSLTLFLLVGCLLQVRLSVHDGTPTIAEKMRGYNAMATVRLFLLSRPCCHSAG